MRSSGFNLIELMVTLAIAALFLALAVPSFDRLIRNNRTETATFTILEATKITRSYAVKANRRVTMQATPQWDKGWQVFYDTNHNGLRDEGEKLIEVHGGLHDSISVEGNRFVRDYISYMGTGASHWASGTPDGSFQAGTIQICPSEGGEGFALVLSRGGRVRKEELSRNDCSSST